MKLVLDDTAIHLNLSNMVDKIQSIYESNKDKIIELPTGGKLDFSRKSVMRIAIKSALVPILLPIVKALYAAKDIPLEKPPKHTDLIDYIVKSTLDFVKLCESETNVYIKTLESDTSNIRRIAAISTNGPIILESSSTGITTKTQE